MRLSWAGPDRPLAIGVAWPFIWMVIVSSWVWWVVCANVGVSDGIEIASKIAAIRHWRRSSVLIFFRPSAMDRGISMFGSRNINVSRTIYDRMGHLAVQFWAMKGSEKPFRSNLYPRTAKIDSRGQRSEVFFVYTRVSRCTHRLRGRPCCGSGGYGRVRRLRQVLLPFPGHV